MKIDSQLITMIAEELHDYKDDLDTFWDTLDGETDVLDAVGQVLENIVEADADLTAVTEIIDKYANRKAVIKQRQERLKYTLKKILMWTGQDKIPHTLATVSLRQGTDSVVIRNDKDIPSQLCKVTVTPDKTEIKKQLKAGVQIDGAELVTGPKTVSIRMK